MLPQSNATLTRVQGASAGESYDGPAAAGADKWQGEVDAYYRVRRDRSQGPGGAIDAVDRVLVIGTHEPEADIRTGDRVTFTFDGQAISGQVKLIERRELPDIEPELQTTRLTLETA